MTNRSYSVLADEHVDDAGRALEALQCALNIGLLDLLPRPFAQHAEQLALAGLLSPPPADRPVLRLTPFEASALARVRRRHAYVPGWRR